MSPFCCVFLPRCRHSQTAWLLVLTACVLLPGGCVRRRLNVRSNPPGALVYVDNQQIGTTPCSVDFTYYGTREIRLVKPGFETLTVNQPIPTPWYEIPPLDFVSENLVPNQIRDNRTVTYDLAPQLVVPNEQLLGRANQLRLDALQYPVQPASNVAPVGAGPPPGVVAPPGTGPQSAPPPFDAPPPAAGMIGPSTPFTAPNPAPFAAPPQFAPPAAAPVQQGPPIVSPPLR